MVLVPAVSNFGTYFEASWDGINLKLEKERKHEVWSTANCIRDG